ncbi:MAG TPA: pyridoxal-phosphate dependent enzyme [Candidatus Paceibacterota bacterium]|nr:pyridoxal-phosphate dependent enzyme [Candidatus Paceibacterota bacterium]
MQTVFSGPDALKDFLDPYHHPPAPLVELPETLNPFLEQGVRIFAKLLYLNPLLNAKWYTVANMLSEANEKGCLENVHTIIEASSGNTAACEAVFANLRGLKMKALVGRDLAPGKLQFLLLLGATPVQPDLNDGQSPITRAKELGQAEGYFNPSQYDNDSNAAAHSKWTGQQIWEQLGTELSIFCAGLGSTGTMVGVSRALKLYVEMSTGSWKPTLLGVVCREDNPREVVPGVRSISRLKEIGFDWRQACDEVIEAGRAESFEQSMALCRHGILGGPSSGFAYEGLLRYLDCRVRQGSLNDLRNKNGEVVAAFICGDTPIPYIEKYSTVADDAVF